jgi:DNA adenine methylase
MMNQFFPQSGWFKVFAKEKTIHSTKGTRQEILWLNYDPRDVAKQKELF